MMLGHRKASTSDIYALFDPLNLGLALSVTEAIMDEIEAVTPGAFTPAMVDLKLIIGGGVDSQTAGFRVNLASNKKPARRPALANRWKPVV
jgi:hypothetical protein